MPSQIAVDPVLKRFRAALDELYGDRLERVVLYGSRARGDHRDGFGLRHSGLPHGLERIPVELEWIVLIDVPIFCTRTDAFISRNAVSSAGAYRERTGFNGRNAARGRSICDAGCGSDHLEKARRSPRSRPDGSIRDIDVADVAAREAYLPRSMGLRRFIVERTGRAAKRHRGVTKPSSPTQRRDQGHFDRELLAFPRRDRYDLKSAADYGVGAGADDISEHDAASRLLRQRRVS